MVMIILGNYKNNCDITTKTAQWALTPKQLNLVLNKKGNTYMYTNKQTHRNLHVGPTLTLLVLNKKSHGHERNFASSSSKNPGE